MLYGYFSNPHYLHWAINLNIQFPLVFCKEEVHRWLGCSKRWTFNNDDICSFWTVLALMEQKGWGRFKTKVALLDFPSWRDLPSQDCYFINNSYGNEGQGRTRFSHKLDVAMNVSLCLPWPCCGIRHCLLGPEGQTQRKKWKASTFLHGTQRQQEKGRERGRKDRMNPISLPLAFFFSRSVIPAFSPSHPVFGSFVLKLCLHCFILI